MFVLRLATGRRCWLLNSGFEHVFPAIRGVQAQREYYVSMCPLSLIPRLFLYDEEELVPELRAQRTLNRGRIPEMTRYVVENPEDYVFSALTASVDGVDGEVRFEPKLESDGGGRVGMLHVPMTAQFIINDGQHRRAAIESAIRERPELGHESIAVVFFIDIGLERCQQMFTDLNRYAIRPSRSLGLLYDHRDAMALLTKRIMRECEAFRGVVETERSTLSPRSRKLFTLSALHSGTSALFGEQINPERLDDTVQRGNEFWAAVDQQIPEWAAVRRREMTAGEVRRDFIHSHSVVLQALGRTGYALIHARPRSWKRQLEMLGSIDWTRTNAKTWEGRAMIGGQVSKARRNVTLTTNTLKQALELELNTDEHRVEEAFLRGDHGTG